MHQLNVLIYGPNSFLSTLNELKPFLKFNHFIKNSNVRFDVIFFHEDTLKDKQTKEIILKSKSLKVCATIKKNIKVNCDAHIFLPTTIAEINEIIEKTVAKKTFNKNSSIKVKQYLLNKNEKKLTKDNNFLVLTEKEIKLLELFLNAVKPISKENILSTVWNYSAEADTHTVETHIYRLRKKINDKFFDDKFILNNKNGYYL